MKSQYENADRIAYGVPELVEKTNMSEGFFRGEIKAGRLQARRAGRRVLVMADDWRSYVEAFWPEVEHDRA